MRKVILICAAVLASSLPIAAQEEFDSATAVPVLVSSASVNWDTPQNYAAMHIVGHRNPVIHANPLIHANPIPPQSWRLDLSASIRETVARASTILSMYDFTVTPFVQNVLVPMVSIAGGRIHLGGYLQMTSSENFELGMPGSGTLPAWGIGMQNHPAVQVPRPDASAGFNISFCLHGTGSRESHFSATEMFGRAVAFVRGI